METDDDSFSYFGLPIIITFALLSQNFFWFDKFSELPSSGLLSDRRSIEVGGGERRLDDS